MEDVSSGLGGAESVSLRNLRGFLNEAVIALNRLTAMVGLKKQMPSQPALTEKQPGPSQEMRALAKQVRSETNPPSVFGTSEDELNERSRLNVNASKRSSSGLNESHQTNRSYKSNITGIETYNKRRVR